MPTDLPVRNTIRMSWQRSQDSLVDADQPAPSYFAGIDYDTTLTRAARPVIDALSSELTNEPVCIILTDAKGVVLDRRGGDRTLIRRLDSVDLAPGFRYAESEVGTNGIGTALEVGGPILVLGEEHYTGVLRGFACAGAPIAHPVTGGLLGVLDITTQAKNSNAVLLSFAKLAARRIQERIVEEANALDQALLSDYYAVCRHTGGSVIALGDEVFMINSHAQQHFDSTDQAALIDRTRDARGGTKPVTFIADLPSGTIARLAYNPTFLGDTLAGGVIQIKEQRSGTRTTSEGRVPALPGLAGTSALWRHTIHEVLDASGRAEWLVAEGEAGVGKLSLLRSVRDYTSPNGRLAVLDAAEPVPTEDFLSHAGAELESGADLIIARAHLLNGEAIEGLTMLLQSARDGSIGRDPWVALTMLTGQTGGSEQLGTQLLHFFPRTVEVPPLRHHLEDIPALVRQLLGRAGITGVTMSPAATNQLMRLPWAGNVTHLRRVLTEVARRRRSGVIELADLPAECRATTRRHLTRMEALERDAVVGALAAHHGDKTAAAAALGMSRATIYRKIRDYGIVT
ncbi:transcriptional regulator of acetoin/glycerol metabolism [Kribbella voronezhensis]|uniref:Transcriptional regulator of acetoin/glycerol metabolism n=1 Tax=Kribbella voronezhensis TaxID=2512212 RepID=A0A4R7SWJ2_9ACTN|nr:helix-turn-helix domain-containing protein [Kribbella voronezhensis]TDU83720.1 transcriptional regulator of acetoin/glycerol metabolism [Kribbella voronezhensis]